MTVHEYDAWSNSVTYSVLALAIVALIYRAGARFIDSFIERDDS